VFEMLGKKAQGKKCEAMEGLIKESESIISDTKTGSKTRDVGLIMACQKVEHYEIASYGGLVQIAKTMGNNEIAEILALTLAEEKEADQILTDVAENNINIQAQQEPSEGEGG
jgi:ferritin-like metal-binding protein YciE